MSGKEFKILNSKINSLLQVTADTGGKNYVTGAKMDYLLKAQESCVLNLIKGIDKKQAERLDFHFKSFNYEIQKLHDDDKVQHTLFMEKVNETKESLFVKVVEIKSLITEEFKKMDENYKELHGKVDVFLGVIT